ncbi:hypothetical protein AB0M46_15550 [Dactylosporangium sp. NPDC051485]|uniref:hypothetical protein n=1 Tax=Dactylosporangium sp. NPDC051485 TaxID=3154846 RepID=UPI0034208140
MALSESQQWKEPGGPPSPPLGQLQATAGQPRQPWPGAIGPAVVGPPPRLTAARPPTPAAAYGAWQGALKPPAFRVSTPRPTYREALPIRGQMVAAGGAAGAAWMLLFGLMMHGSARGYVWITLVAGILAWVAAAILARFGDRGVAVGVAASSGIALAIAGILVAYRLAGGDWLLW